MSMTDPIADLLTRIRNGQLAKHATVDVPASNIKVAIVKIMKDEGYLTDFELVGEGARRTIRVTLKYLDSGGAAIQGIERVSRSGRRVYRGRSELPRVLNGLGMVVVSTPLGILTGSECRRKGVGGEVLCTIW